MVFGSAKSQLGKTIHTGNELIRQKSTRRHSPAPHTPHTVEDAKEVALVLMVF